MALTLADNQAMLAGFSARGYILVTHPPGATNPVQIEWHVNQEVRRFRLWTFDITHGGASRPPDEFRIQVTNGPVSMAELDPDGAIDLLLGYSPGRDVIVAFDRRWLEKWTQKKESTGEGGSPSAQVREAEMQAGLKDGMHHFTKEVKFGTADILAMRPEYLPSYLLDHENLLRGTMSVNEPVGQTAQSTKGNILAYCRTQGFPFEADVVARYLASIQTKPFVILAGVSGTGKSKLAELVAEFYSLRAASTSSATPAPAVSEAEKFLYVEVKLEPDRERFALVAVRPDWIDGQSIVGFVNPLTDKYESTQALDLILRARRAMGQSPTPAQADRHFLLLDEMNLARVEHYFSDWLACAESRRDRGSGTIVQQSVPLHRANAAMQTALQKADGSTELVDVPASIELPTNLIVTGTVNVDETTYGLSPKVLDRAMVLEFDEVNLDRLRNANIPEPASSYRFPDALRPFSLPSATDYQRLPAEAHELLKTLNGVLEEARLHFGYRSANELALFMSIYNDILPVDSTDSSWLRALDAGVLQKVLPRLSGSRAKLESMMTKLCGFLRDLQVSAETGKDFDPSSVARLPKSYRRAVEMLQALRDFGFASFFK